MALMNTNNRNEQTRAARRSVLPTEFPLPQTASGGAQRHDADAHSHDTARAESIRELARPLERNASPVHSDLTKLESYGLVAFEQGDNRAKQPIVPYDRIRIDVTTDEIDRAVASG